MSGGLQAFPPLFQLCRAIVIEPATAGARSAMYRQSIGVIPLVGYLLAPIEEGIEEEQERSWPRPILIGCAVPAGTCACTLCLVDQEEPYRRADQRRHAGLRPAERPCLCCARVSGPIDGANTRLRLPRTPAQRRARRPRQALRCHGDARFSEWTECFYTVYTRSSGGDWYVTSFRQPQLACKARFVDGVMGRSRYRSREIHYRSRELARRNTSRRHSGGSRQD